MMLDLSVVIDNNPSIEDIELLTEHGLSFYMEIDGLTYLFDLGASNKWINNANKLGIAIEEIDFLILSHGHRDHTGGLETFLQLNKKAKIYVSEKIFKYEYLTYRHDKARNISSDKSLLSKNNDRFILLKENFNLSENIYLIHNQTFEHLLPVGNHFLNIIEDGIEKPYVPNDELIVVVRLKDSIVILSACSHNGILNIIQSSIKVTRCSNILAFIGGTHLVDCDLDEKDNITSIANFLVNKYSKMHLYTGHCSGSNSIDIFSKILKDRFTLFHSGMKLRFND